MVKEGYYFGLPPLALGAAALFLRWTIAGVILLCLAAFIFYFFRDPERVIPADAGAIVSPAAGTIAKIDYRPGKFSAAMRESASADNEQNVITLATDTGEIVFKQIA